MAFTRNTVVVNNITNQPNQPIISATALKALFDQSDVDQKSFDNSVLLPELESTTDGDSGLDNIGMTPIGIYTNAQTMLEHLEADKTPLTGNHLGTWQGYSPVQSDPGIQAIVNEHTLKLNDVTYAFNSIYEMKSSNILIVDNIVTTSGYYSNGDGGGGMYVVKNNNALIDDGGSVHNLQNGLKAVLICENGVDCKLFGCTESDTLPEDQSIATFDNWTAYVNNTSGKFFAPSGGKTFRLYKPLYIQKSFKGVNFPRFIYMSTAVGKVVSNTAYTAGSSTYYFNVAAVMGINPPSQTDTEDRFEISNFQLYCTNADDDVSPSQDYGIYFPKGNATKVENVLVYRPTKAGFYFKEFWMSELVRLNTWGSRYDGFLLEGTFTSLTMRNCYAHVFKHYGFVFSGALYSTFQDLSADSGIGIEGSYSIGSCYSTNFYNLGSESCVGNKLIGIGDFTGTISGIFAFQNEFAHSVIYIHRASQATLENIKIMNCTRKPSNTVYSYFLLDSLAEGTSNIIFNVPTRQIDLSGYNADVWYDSLQGRYRFNIKERPYTFHSNETKYEVLSKAILPTTSTSVGVKGEISSDSNWLYICYSDNLWKRVAISSF